MEAAKEELHVSIDNNDINAAYNALASYRRLTIEYVELDCDIVLVKVTNGQFDVDNIYR